jgi:hypothetical protein
LVDLNPTAVGDSIGNNQNELMFQSHNLCLFDPPHGANSGDVCSFCLAIRRSKAKGEVDVIYPSPRSRRRSRSSQNCRKCPRPHKER